MDQGVKVLVCIAICLVTGLFIIDGFFEILCFAAFVVAAVNLVKIGREVQGAKLTGTAPSLVRRR